MNPLLVLLCIALQVLPARFGGGQDYSSDHSSSSSSSPDNRSSSSSSRTEKIDRGPSEPSDYHLTDPTLKGMLALYPVLLDLTAAFFLYVPLAFILFRKRWSTENQQLFVLFCLCVAGIVLFVRESSGDGMALMVFWCAFSVLGMKAAQFAAKTSLFPNIAGPIDPAESASPRVTVREKPREPSVVLIPGADPHLGARILGAWPRLQNAWADQNLDAVRSFLSDGLQIRTQIQLEAMKRRNIRNRLENGSIERIEFKEHHDGPHFTTCTVAIHARGIDGEFSIDSGRVVRQGQNLPFLEYWTFVKQSGVPSPPTGLLEGVCPHCRASLEAGLSTTCSSCGSKIKSGRFDWVLTEISQEGAWSPRTESIDKHLRDLIERDPGFSISALEDHASMVFWRLIQAIPEGRTKIVGHLISETSLLDLRRRWSDLVMGDWFHLEPVIGSVEVAGHEVVDAKDRVRVKIRWQLGPKTRLSKPVPIDPISKLMSRAWNAYANYTKSTTTWDHPLLLAAGQDGLEEDRESLAFFERSVEETTPIDRNLTTGHCRVCGGPEIQGACSWCNATMSNVPGNWILSDLRPGHKGLGI